MKSAEEVIWWVLKIIKRQIGIEAYGLVTVISLDFKNFISKDSDSPSISEIVKVIIKLERERKILEIADKRSEGQKYGFDFEWDNACYFVLEIDKGKFEELYLEYSKKHYEQNRREFIQDSSNLIRQKEIQADKNCNLPSGWILTKDKLPQIKKDEKVVFTFPNDWSHKYKYFKCLFENCGIKKDFKDLYEFESNLVYPEKNVWIVNRNIRSIINKLRKEFKSKNLPLHMETNKGFTLSITSNYTQ